MQSTLCAPRQEEAVTALGWFADAWQSASLAGGSRRKPGDQVNLHIGHIGKRGRLRVDNSAGITASLTASLQGRYASALFELASEQNVAAAMRIADRVVIMNNGQIVFDGLPDEARASNFWNYF